MIKKGLCKQFEANGFPNYFVAQKVRAKVLIQDEKQGNEELLGYVRNNKAAGAEQQQTQISDKGQPKATMDDNDNMADDERSHHNQKTKRKPLVATRKNMSRGNSRHRQKMRANHDSAGEMEVDEEEQVRKVFQKHTQLVESRRQEIITTNFDKMMFYLQCDMNLLVYGVGSKHSMMQEFVRDYINLEWSTVFVLGYCTELVPKKILFDIINYLDEEVDHKPKK